MALMMNGKEVNHLIIGGEQFDKNLIGKSISLEAGYPVYSFSYNGTRNVLVNWGVSNKRQNCTITEVIESISFFGESTIEPIIIAKLDSVEVYKNNPEGVYTYKNTMFIKLQ